MKKLVLGLVAVLGLSAPALAQSYVGVKAGYPGVGLHFGVQNAITADLGFRISASYGLPFFLPAGASNILIEGDVTYRLPMSGTPGLSAYVGAGPAISLWNDGTTGGTSFGVGFLGGIEYSVMPNISVFFEANPAYFFQPLYGTTPTMAVNFNFAGGLGVNYRF